MVTPLPGPDEVLLLPPDAEEAAATARGIASAVHQDGELTELQRFLLDALVPAMTGHPSGLEGFVPFTPAEYGAVLARRDIGFRTRGVQLMVLCALVLRPLPKEVADRIDEFARELGVEEGMVGVAQQFAAGALGLAAIDFDRNGYTSTWGPDAASALHTSHELASAWEFSVTEADLAERWAALGHLPAGTLGRGVWELYRARGFSFPGSPGSAPPLLAQHDWVHVLADFGTTVESEIEVFGFIARANDEMRAFSLLAMVISLFETGYLRTGAGLFEASEGHVSGHGRDVAMRLADAMGRGARCTDTATGNDSIDFLRVDWFELAPLPVDEVRARFHVLPKSDAARAAGSVGPWEPGGISPFQLAAGQAFAASLGLPYDSFGAG